MPRSEAAAPRRSFGSGLLRIGLALAGVLGLFVAGEYFQRLVTYRQGFTSAWTEPGWDMLHALYHRTPHPAGEAALARSGLPVLSLAVEPEDLRELRRTAEKVLAAGVSRKRRHGPKATLTTIDYSWEIRRDYVPAKLLSDGRWIDVDLKLRGLEDYHYAPQRPSLRIRFPENRPFRGMEQVNLSHPYDKGVTKDVTTNRELARYGLLTWESDFVVLEVNGDVVGLFQLIEQLGRPLLDREGRSEGFIFSGTGEVFGDEGGVSWDKAVAVMERFLGCGAEDQVLGVEPCDWPFVEATLDLDRFAWAAAMATLLGSYHAWIDDNLRVYYDPARGRLEPIPWDYFSYRISPEEHPDGERASRFWGEHLAGFPEFRRMRDQRLWTLATERVEPMIAHARELFSSLEEVLAHDDLNPLPRWLLPERLRSSYATWSADVHRAEVEEPLRANAELFRELFSAHDLRADGYRTGEDGRLTIDLTNHAKAFVAVTEVRLDLSGEAVTARLEAPRRVDGVWGGEPGRARVTLAPAAFGRRELPATARLAGLAARNEVTGKELESGEIVVRNPGGPAPRPNAAPPAGSASPELPPGARLANGSVVFGPGRVRLAATLEVPRRYPVVLAPGLDLTLADGASLIVYGDLTAVGTAEAPISIGGAASELGWGSLVVQGERTAPSRVHLEHVTIRGGSGAENARSRFTGALSVTDGEVTLRHCRFLDSGADDGINLKYCRVELADNLWRGARDDAVDLDFCRGTMSGNRVEGAGGDGIDLSGSTVRLTGNRVTGCGDKGYSVGERSRAEITGGAVRDCRVGIASKDASEAIVRRVELTGLEVAVALYRKKLTFVEPPAASLSGVTITDVATSFLEGPGLRIATGPAASESRPAP